MVNSSPKHTPIRWTDGPILDDIALLRTLPNRQCYLFKRIQLELAGPGELETLQQFLLHNAFPELEGLSVKYEGPVAVQLTLPSFPSLTQLVTRGLLIQSGAPTVPRLRSIGCDAQLDQYRPTQPSQQELRILLNACSGASDVQLKHSFFPSPRFDRPYDHPVPFPNLRTLWVEDGWDYLPNALAHLAASPASRVDIVAHTDVHDFDLDHKGFWLDILPPNRSTSLPMLSSTRAIRLSANLFEPYAVDVRVPLANGATLSGSSDPLSLDVLDAQSSWSITATNCREHSEELIPTTLSELPRLIDCSKLVVLEMHTVPYLSPDRSTNEWETLLATMIALERLEIGGNRALELVLDAFVSTEDILPALRVLVLCLGILPDEERLDDLAGLFSSTCSALAERQNRLKLLQVRIPPRDVGRLAKCSCLMEDTTARAGEFVQFASQFFPAQVVRKFCKSCHDGHPSVFREYEDDCMMEED